MGRGRHVADRIGLLSLTQRSFAVNWLTKCVDHAAKPAFIGVDLRLGIGQLNFAANADPVQNTKRHQQCAFIAKPDDFANHGFPIATLDLTPVTDRQRAFNTTDFNQ